MISFVGIVALILCGLGFGVLVAAGVFTVLIAVGLIPRFAWKTHTGNRVFLYEECAIWGAVLGGEIGLFMPKLCTLRRQFEAKLFVSEDMWVNDIWTYVSACFFVIVGLFFGIFVGCLAVAIAEMLDGIPIMIRRYTTLCHRQLPTFTAERYIMGPVLVAVAFGKCMGSLIYFALLLWKG